MQTYYLFLGLWEERFVYSTSNVFREKTVWWGHYIDDFFFLFFFAGSEKELLDFHAYINSSNEKLRVNLEYEKTEIHVLDLTIRKDAQGYHYTSVYREPTDRNTILHGESFHPPCLMKNIPYGQFQRLRWICDSDKDFKVQSTILTQQFEQRAGVDCSQVEPRSKTTVQDFKYRSVSSVNRLL